jgi:hypothetical protein
VGLIVLALTSTSLSWTGPIGAVLTFPFLLAGPGIAIVGILRIRDPLLDAALVVPLSLSVQALIATMFVYLGMYSAPLVMVVSVGVSLAALLADRPGPPPPPPLPGTRGAVRGDRAVRGASGR